MIDVYPRRRKQQLGNLVAAKICRVVQRLFLEVVKRVDVRPVLEQQDRNVIVPGNGDVVQCRFAVLVGQVNIGFGCQ